MLMITVLHTRLRQQHVNKATGELAWKRRVQRSLDARRGRDVEKKQRDKTDDCCLFVIAVLSHKHKFLLPFYTLPLPLSSILSFPFTLFSSLHSKK